MPPLTSLTLPYITATLAARLEVVISPPCPASHLFTLRTEFIRTSVTHIFAILCATASPFPAHYIRMWPRRGFTA